MMPQYCKCNCNDTTNHESDCNDTAIPQEQSQWYQESCKAIIAKYVTANCKSNCDITMSHTMQSWNMSPQVAEAIIMNTMILQVQSCCGLWKLQSMMQVAGATARKAGRWCNNSHCKMIVNCVVTCGHNSNSTKT